MAAATEFVHVACPKCLAQNRVDAARVHEAPKCGRCETLLLDDAIVELDEASFDAFVARTSVPVRAQFAKSVAQGTREAIEREVPNVGPINARTQDLLGLDRAATQASNTGHILSRLGGAGISAGIVGSGGGLLPAVAAAGAGALLTTPGGLTATGLALRPIASHLPSATRAAILAALLSEEAP